MNSKHALLLILGIPILTFLHLKCTTNDIHTDINPFSSLPFLSKKFQKDSVLSQELQVKVYNKLNDYIKCQYPFSKANIRLFWHPEDIKKIPAPGLTLLNILRDRNEVQNLNIDWVLTKEISAVPLIVELELDFYKKDAPLTILQKIKLPIEIDSSEIYFRSPLLMNIDKLNCTNTETIRFIYDSTITPTPFAIKQAESFNQFISNFFLQKTKSFDCIISKNKYDTYKKLGFYSSNQIGRTDETHGLAHAINNMIFSGNGSAFYPHEIVHLYIPDNTHYIFNEGMATYFGGSRGLSTEEVLKFLYQWSLDNPDFDFSQLNNYKDHNTKINLSYAVGCLIITTIMEEYHTQMVRNILEKGTSSDDFFKTTKSIIGIHKENFNHFVRSKATLYGFTNT